MPSKTSQPQDAPQKDFNNQLNQVVSFNGEAMQAFADACTAYADCVSDLNKEFMTFVSSRLSRDMELSQALTACENWTDAVAVQQKWAQQATHEYMEEAGRISALASKIAKESWAPVYKGVPQVGGAAAKSKT